MATVTAAVEPLSQIIEDTDWLTILSRWHKTGGQTISINMQPLETSQARWKQLSELLHPTGWFRIEDGKITPMADGKEFLYRANELLHLMSLHARGELIPAQLADAPRGAVLDLGCGTGYSLLLLGRMGYAPLYGYDLSPIALQMAETMLRREGMTASLYSKDATLLEDVPDAHIALIYSKGALHYFDLTQIAGSFRRVLRDDGWIFTEVKAFRYYRQIFRDLRQGQWRRAASYGAVIARTLIHEAFRQQPSDMASDFL